MTVRNLQNGLGHPPFQSRVLLLGGLVVDVGVAAGVGPDVLVDQAVAVSVGLVVA